MSSQINQGKMILFYWWCSNVFFWRRERPSFIIQRDKHCLYKWNL